MLLPVFNVPCSIKVDFHHLDLFIIVLLNINKGQPVLGVSETFGVYMGGGGG